MKFNFEYILLRFLRKKIFTGKTLRLVHSIIPYYEVNKNEVIPDEIIDIYEELFRSEKINLSGKTILEIGCGATNSVGYILQSKYNCKIYCNEPYEVYDVKLDQNIQDQLIKNGYKFDKTKILRNQSIEEIKDKVDVVISKSVLEHVYDLDKLFAQLKSVTKEEANMIHVVDFRDHFFKYPFEFLKFSDTVWRKWLDSGTLPRNRTYDVENVLKKFGFKYRVTNVERLEEEFQKVKPYLDQKYAGKMDDELNISWATYIS